MAAALALAACPGKAAMAAWRRMAAGRTCRLTAEEQLVQLVQLLQRRLRQPQRRALGQLAQLAQRLAGPQAALLRLVRQPRLLPRAARPATLLRLRQPLPPRLQPLQLVLAMRLPLPLLLQVAAVRLQAWGQRQLQAQAQALVLLLPLQLQQLLLQLAMAALMRSACLLAGLLALTS